MSRPRLQLYIAQHVSYKINNYTLAQCTLNNSNVLNLHMAASTKISSTSTSINNYRVAQKSKPPPIFQKMVLKIANEVRFLRKVEV